MSEHEGQAAATASLLASMAQTRLELAALDVEAHVTATLTSYVMGAVALVFTLIALTFCGVAVIALCWDTHRVAATLSTTLAYVAFAGFLVLRARSIWKARPPALAATLHELGRDRDALRGPRR